MCALFGWFRPKLDARANRKTLLKHLARKSQAWGDKSFGLAALVKGKVQVMKFVGPASQWIEQAKDLEEWAKADVLIGHTRLPTKGAVTKANCHPFVAGDWVSAHNGCISNSAELMAKALHVAKGETDSEEALCWAATKNFSPESMKEIEGSFAFEALKKDGSELVLVCDDRQRLSVARVGDGAVWCTDWTSLESSLEAAGIPLETSGVAPAVFKLEGKVLRLPAKTIEDIPSKYASYESIWKDKRSRKERRMGFARDYEPGMDAELRLPGIQQMTGDVPTKTDITID